MSLISMMDENRKMGRGKWNGRTDRGNECALELAQLTARCRDVSRPSCRFGGLRFYTQIADAGNLQSGMHGVT